MGVVGIWKRKAEVKISDEDLCNIEGWGLAEMGPHKQVNDKSKQKLAHEVHGLHSLYTNVQRVGNKQGKSES